MLSCLKYPPSSFNSPPHPLNYALTFPPNHSCRVRVLRHLTVNRNRVSALTRRCQAKSADTEKPVSLDNENDLASSTTSSSSTSFLSFLCPLLKLFSQGDPSQARNYNLEFTTSFLSTLARFPWGSTAVTDSLNNQGTISSDPPQRLQLFEFEACPFCRRVREAMTELDLSVDVYPCPKGSIKHREFVKQLGGKELFPFLVDPNTGVSMYESGDIVKYLFQQYGKRSPSVGLLESTLFTGWMPTLLRAGRGMSRWEKATPDMPPKKLELFSYENNPNARIVREALCELEIPYVLLNVGAGSKRTDLLINLSGNQKVPYLVDPNTGAEIGDYKEILAYLFKTYSLAAT